MICNTSPLQYLHQIERLHILHELVGHIIVPSAVVEKLATGRSFDIELPDVSKIDWITVRQPIIIPATLLTHDLGPGETEVISLALEARDPVVILDDGLARRVAEAHGIRLTGTLGILIDAKRKGLISEVSPQIDRLQEMGFWLAPDTRSAILRRVGEAYLSLDNINWNAIDCHLREGGDPQRLPVRHVPPHSTPINQRSGFPPTRE